MVFRVNLQQAEKYSFLDLAHSTPVFIRAAKVATSKLTSQLSTKQSVSLRFAPDHCSSEQSEKRNNLSCVFWYHPIIMTNYQLKPVTILSSLAAQEKKEQRKKLLEEVRARRKVIYKRFHKKRQLQADADLI